MPDYSIFHSLCKELGITVIELLNGEKNKKEDTIITDYIEFKEKKNKIKILVVIGFCIFVMLFSFLLMYFINNYKKINIYKLSAQSEKFIYEDGLLVLSNINNILEYGNIKSNEVPEEEILFYELTVFKNNEYYLLLRSDIDNEIYVDSYGYEEIISESLKNNITQNVYLLIYYRDNNELKIEKMKINCQKILTNDKLINKKNKPISTTKKRLKSSYNNYLEKIDYQDELYNQGFRYINNPFLQSQNYLTKKISDNEYISINLISNYLYYNYQDNMYEVRAIYNFK